MSAIFEGRISESPHIEMVWRGRVEEDYAPVCPADARWNLLFVKHKGQIRASAEGPTTAFVPKSQPEGAEFLVIKFKLGTFMPHMPVLNLRDGDAELPGAASRSFWLQGTAWELPSFDNAEVFVDRLVREELLIHDPVVETVLKNEPADLSMRSLRRRFLQATGLSQGAISQIERAQQAAALLERGTPILDAVHQAGYADQPHMTRSLRRFYGFTPAQIMRTPEPS